MTDSTESKARTKRLITRRQAMIGGALGAGSMLSGCDALNENPGFRALLRRAEDANYAIHNSLVSREALAQEFPVSAISANFPPNGTINPQSAAYQRFAARDFAGWPLSIRGMVKKAQTFRLDEIRSMPVQSQITRHDCVEGWSAIAKWTGVRLSHLLDLAGLEDKARYLVFHCADTLGGRPYYESIDLIDAYHPQTIIAWAMNDKAIPIGNGAPLRLRVERQLGYKHAKYLVMIEAVDDLSGFYGGKGGYWEDVADYEWYAGI